MLKMHAKQTSIKKALQSLDERLGEELKRFTWWGEKQKPSGEEDLCSAETKGNTFQPVT